MLFYFIYLLILCVGASEHFGRHVRICLTGQAQQSLALSPE